MFNRHETIKDYIKKYKISSIIILINVIVFLMQIFLGITFTEKYAAVPRLESEYYRIITYMFLHGGIMHLLLNMFSIYVFCCEYEKMVGTTKFIFVYIISGILSGLTIYIISDGITVGASGAIFGIFGAMYAYSIKNKYAFDLEAKKVLVIIMAMNIIFTFITPNVSVSGHFGGLIAGFIFGYAIINNKKKA